MKAIKELQSLLSNGGDIRECLANAFKSKAGEHWRNVGSFLLEIEDLAGEARTAEQSMNTGDGGSEVDEKWAEVKALLDADYKMEQAKHMGVVQKKAAARAAQHKAKLTKQRDE